MRTVSEQYILPLLLALGTLTAAICNRNEELSRSISDILRSQAESCRPNDDVTQGGWVLLEVLANIATAPTPSAPADLEEVVRNSLRLIKGGKKDQEK